MNRRTAQQMVQAFTAALVILLAPATGSPGPSLSQQPDAGRFFLSDGVRIHYSEEGSGPPVVLLRGFAVDGEFNWRATGIVAALSGQFRVITLDHRGHGLSEKPRDPGAYGVHMVSDIVNLLDHLDIARTHVVGYSMGSTIALTLATMYPERVMSLVLGATGWIEPGTEWVAQLRRRSRALEELRAGQSITEVLRPPGAPAPPPALQAKLDANDPRALAAVSRQLPELWISKEALRANDVRTLAVIGERDELRPTVEAMIGIKPNLQVKVLAGRDHFSALQDPDFRGVIVEFLASPNAAPSPQSGTAPVTRPGETVRIVRFNVKPDGRESFERFFWESLRPAAATRAGVPVEDLDLGGFRLLIPSKPNPQGYFTYYVLVDPAGGPLGAGEVMRDMVREAFPGDEGQERVRRWMESIVLAAPFAPAGEEFVEADLRRPRVSNPGRR
jgi:pimeloyl-ACP methyl ester carboxylesterase